VAERPPAVFVYGTLMPGRVRWPFLQSFAGSSRPATARGHLWDTGRGYPAARFDSGAGEIPGVLVTIVPDRFGAALAVLDRIEGEGVLYRRVEVDTSVGPAISYEWLGSTEGFVHLPDGWPARVDPGTTPWAPARWARHRRRG
jgi:gamma-glutamylcyclotransferase (GGCT)/AIG2-like uncharacterized protein YtfP